jgi:hypothetical protein
VLFLSSSASFSTCKKRVHAWLALAGFFARQGSRYAEGLYVLIFNKRDEQSKMLCLYDVNLKIVD